LARPFSDVPGQLGDSLMRASHRGGKMVAKEDHDATTH